MMSRMIKDFLLPKKRPRFRLWRIPGSNSYLLKRKILWWWFSVLHTEGDYSTYEWTKDEADYYVGRIFAKYDPVSKKKLKNTLQKEYM